MSSSSKPSSKWQLHSAFMQALYIEARHYRSLIEKEKPGIAPTLSLCRVAHHTGRLNTNYVLGKHKTDNESTSPLFISHCIILIFSIRNFPLDLKMLISNRRRVIILSKFCQTEKYFTDLNALQTALKVVSWYTKK